MYELKTEQFLLTVKSSLYPQLNIEELDHKAKEKLTSQRIGCGFLTKWLSRGWETVSRLFRVFNAEKKLFNSAQVAQTKIPRNEVKICQETDFLTSEGHLLTFPGCCLTLASSLDVVQVRFASWSVYRFLLGNGLSNLSNGETEN